MVSIRCLVYNHEPFLRQCLDGFVMQQVNFSYEAIVHDDASTDGSAEIIKEYAEKYPDIIKPILETENQYSKRDGSLRRIMNAHTRGKYVALCEGDDYWTDPLKLQKQVDFLESHPDYSMCCHAATIKTPTSEYVKTHNPCEDCDLSTKDIFLKGGDYITTASICFRSALLNGLSAFSDGCPVGDYPLQMWCAMNGNVRHMQNDMSVYRLGHVGSWTNSVLIDETISLAELQFIEWCKSCKQKIELNYERLFSMLLGKELINAAARRSRYSSLRWNKDVILYLMTMKFTDSIKLFLKIYFPIIRLIKRYN